MGGHSARRVVSATKQTSHQLPLTTRSTGDQIRTTHTPELVIALCGPIGSPLHDVAATLEELLRGEYDYKCLTIRVSKHIERHTPAAASGTQTAYGRANDLIERGNNLRKTHGNSVLAELAVRAVSLSRESEHQKQPADQGATQAPKRFAPLRMCHIIDSIKNTAELETLRLVYGPLLHTVGVFSSEQHRVSQLAKGISNRAEVQALIDRDADESLDYGQSVRATFPLCDYFLRGDVGKKKLDDALKRLLELIFGVGVITPTTSETAMYQATSAARSSACLSRQVGAAIVDAHGQLISVGWNDVPKPMGGVYSAEDDGDCRCCNYKDGACHNDAQKSQISREVAEALAAKGLIKLDDVPQAMEIVRKSRVGSLIEFSRAIHAEMHAVVLGSQLGGERMKGASLYCTTYPCHGCARHIVLAGIKTVYYIEPYAKSQAIALHDDAISEAEADSNKVRFLPYEGVGPNRYLETFAVGSNGRKSKSDGKLVRQQKSVAVPKDNRSLESFPTLEGLVVTHLHTRGLLSQNAPSHEGPA